MCTYINMHTHMYMYMGFSGGASRGKEPTYQCSETGLRDSTHTYGWFNLKNSSLGELGSNSLYKDGPNIIQQHGSL